MTVDELCDIVIFDINGGNNDSEFQNGLGKKHIEGYRAVKCQDFLVGSVATLRRNRYSYKMV